MQMDLILIMRFLGEFTGTAMLVCLGCMGCTNGDVPLMTSLHTGLVVMIVVHCFGFVSGAHANPCISLACCLMGYITAKITAVYMLAQFLGAIFGYFLLTLLLSEGEVTGKKLCMTVPASAVSSEQAFAIEYLLTAIVILGWCALWDVRNSRYLDSISLRVGLLVAACSVAGGPLTGASMNPARTLAPAIFNNDFETIGIYFASQLLAAITIPYIWWYLFIPRCRFTLSSDDSQNMPDDLQDNDIIS